LDKKDGSEASRNQSQEFLGERKEQVKVVGAELSTFTRTIRLALHEKGVSYQLEKAVPHSLEACQHHPFGKIPSFCHNDFWLFESSAIARYIDRAFPQLPCLTSLQVERCALIDQWVSAISDNVFRVVEFELVKPSHALFQQGRTRQEIVKQLQTGINNSAAVLAIVEKLASDKPYKTQGEYLLGSLSWVDLFLIPIISDMLAVSGGDEVLISYPNLQVWFRYCAKTLHSVSLTSAGTVADTLGQAVAQTVAQNLANS